MPQSILAAAELDAEKDLRCSALLGAESDLERGLLTLVLLWVGSSVHVVIDVDCHDVEAIGSVNNILLDVHAGIRDKGRVAITAKDQDILGIPAAPCLVKAVRRATS